MANDETARVNALYRAYLLGIAEQPPKAWPSDEVLAAYAIGALHGRSGKGDEGMRTASEVVMAVEALFDGNFIIPAESSFPASHE